MGRGEVIRENLSLHVLSFPRFQALYVDRSWENGLPVLFEG